jgi:hypothetical protein
VEATRVLLEDNYFVILKVAGIDLVLEDIPAFKFLTEDQVKNPVLRTEVGVVGQRRTHSNDTFTLITASEGVQSIIAALWRLKENGDHVVMSRPSDLSLSLNFKVKASVWSEALSKLVLKPWERLHGVKQLVLTGDIGHSTYQRLEQCMLEGPMPVDLAFSLRGYHFKGETEMSQKNYSAALWWWTLYDLYWSHLGHFRSHVSTEHEMKNANNQLWNGALKESKRMYFKGKLGMVKALLHQFRYKEALMNIADVRREANEPVIDIDYPIRAILNAKFYLCGALAKAAIGETQEAMRRIKTAAIFLDSSDQVYDHTAEITRDIQRAVTLELVRLKSLWGGEWLPTTRGYLVGWEIGDAKRSFWEWLDVPEDWTVSGM